MKNLKTGETAAIHADSIFPTASMIKVSILIGIMDKIQKGELDYHQPLLYRDSLLYAGEDLLGSFKDNEKIELSKVVMLMLTMSDNTASLWLQSLAGGGATINAKLNELGLKYTRVNSRVPGRETERNIYGWGQTTPREMVDIFERIYKGKIINPAISARMLRLLGRDFWDEEAISQIPPRIFVAAKSGAVDASRSETLLVMAPHGPYLFSVITKQQTDTSWAPGNEGWVMERKLSRLLWDYFEPALQWNAYINTDGKLND
ncbi:MAG TPA: serine hydrolase [Puia sp.]|nr:serine hydrolase [Puia sp.]